MTRATGGFVDIHSHIAYALDDGSPSQEVSVAMLQLAFQSGTTDIVATPHANTEYAYDPGIVAERVETLQALAPTGMRIHRGCDFHLSFQNVQRVQANPSRFTINGEQYLLVELPDFTIYPNIQSVFQSLFDVNVVPIITHPERNAILQQRLSELESWVEHGCLIQVTAQSLLGGFGGSAKQFSRKLLANNLVHFVATDAHDCERRPPRLDLAFEHVSHEHGQALAERLFINNPACVVEGEELESTGPIKQGQKRSWYQRLFRGSL